MNQGSLKDAEEVKKLLDTHFKGLNLISYVENTKNVIDEALGKNEKNKLEVTIQRNSSDKYNINIGYETYSKNGEKAMIERTIRMDAKGDIVIYHDEFGLPKEAQGKGTAAKILKVQYQEYKQLALHNKKSVSLATQANSDIGGYAWAKYGFTHNVNNEQGIWNFFNWSHKHLADDNRKVKGDSAPEGCLTESDIEGIEDIIEAVAKKNNYNIPMNVIANLTSPDGRKIGKTYLLGSDWMGKVDLKNKAQTSVFDEYLNSKLQ